MFEKPLTVLFYGPSGSGKGTQAKLLQEFLRDNDSSRQSEYVETGALVRSFMETSGYSQELVRDAVGKGGLLPSFIPVYLWTKVLIEQLDGSEHLLLDGLARREQTTDILDGALRFYGRHDYVVISFELSEQSIRDRLHGRGRGDDANESSVDEKLRWYREEVVPAIASIEKLGATVHRIDAEPSIEDIHKTVLETLHFK